MLAGYGGEALRDWPIRHVENIAHGDAGSFGRTVPWLRQLVVEGARHPLVQQRAHQLAAASPHLHPADAVFRYVQSMPYRQDTDIADPRWGDDVSEVLQGAAWQVQRELQNGLGSVEGDCDCRSVLFQSLCEALGYPTRFVVVRGPGRRDYSHIYSEVELGGSWTPADTIMDGNGGRPLLGLGQAVGAPVARDPMRIDVRQSVVPIVAMGLFLLWQWRKRS